MKNNWNSVAARISFFVALSSLVWLSWAKSTIVESEHHIKARPVVDTTIQPIWPNEDNPNPSEGGNGIEVPLPDNIEYTIEYNSETGEYEVVQKVGDKIDFRPRTTMTLEEYLDFNLSKNVTEYWIQQQQAQSASSKDFAPFIKVGGEGFENIFGSNEIEIRPQGSAELTFGVNISKTENPRIPERQRRITTFDFDQKIQLNVVGNIGTKMKLNVNYNTESTFEFENQMKLEYTGDEDQIIRKIELGNVSLPLKGSLIQGSSSLFGGKIETQWGRLKNTTVFSQQKGERRNITVQGGAQTQNFSLTGDNYEANRHYFLSTWFRDQYDNSLAALPVVNSGVNITRIEVWVVNQQANTQDVRNVIAFSDLGERYQYMSTDYDIGPLFNGSEVPNPDNENNRIYELAIADQNILNYTGANAAITSTFGNIRQGVHYERIGNARKLTSSEYTFNTRLGFISLKQALNNAEVLAVSYEYTLNGQTYQVGTLSQDGIAAPQALILKLLKSSVTAVRLTDGNPAPLWRNMMKNVYNLGAFGIAPENFDLQVYYNNPSTGIDQNFIARDPLNGKLLIQVLNLDRIDAQQMSGADGFFDFISNAATSGGLIDAQSGRVFFPNVEPFGSHLADKITEGLGNTPEAEQMISQIVYQPLYDSTKTAAQVQFPNLNRFKIKGKYQSASGSEISLNSLNIPQGSVSVTAGGIALKEGTDYTVDYNLGRVKILNEGVLSSGQAINISVESNSLFNMQFKTMIGSRFDYQFNDYFTAGATVLNLRERPITQKVNAGEEPVNNTVVGGDFNFQKDTPFLTQLVDRIPLIDTKEKSSISFSGEVAKLFPGHSRAISKTGNAYVDDFEGSQSVIDLRSLNQWFLASTPKMQSTPGGLFPEGAFEDSLIYGYNRARLSWYVIDPLFYRANSLTPPNVDADMQSDHRMREVLESEVFPNRELPPGTPPNIATLDLTFRPTVRGPYNYDRPEGTTVSAGLNPDGSLASPESRWGGIQRSLTTTDFETSNVQFIQFWLMDPFNEDSENLSGGDLYFNLGNVSEDVLNDSQLSFENGYPTDNNDLPTLQSTWGVYPDPATFNVVNAFDNSTGNYAQQDIGIDGLNSAEEQSFFAPWLASIQSSLTADAYASIAQDPSADDYAYFRSSSADAASLSTIDRYERYNSYEGNANTSTPDGYPITATTIPNTEDINQDITLNTIESYFQYKVSLRPGDLGENNIGENYITDSFVTTKETANGEEREIRWYQFKIPIQDWETSFGSISDFRSIRYIRMFMKGWDQEVTLRFARLELVRGEWRKYYSSLDAPQELEPNDDDETIFNIAAVNIEENGNREPVPYVVPPGIIREQDVASANLRNMNEQALAFEVCNLRDGNAKAAYRNVNFDMRQYKKLRMFAHAEALTGQNDLASKDLTVFIRLGSDFDQNYYEYEMPMNVTPWYTNDDDEIWPEDNNFEISLDDLQQLKIERGTTNSILQEYSKMIENARVSIKGNPNLANVTVMMIGVRNPDKDNNTFSSTDDGKSKCAIIWVNELRLSEFNEKGGWAAVARMNAQLADFATLAVAGNISTPGWGSLEQTVQERQQETKMGFDANSTVQMGKFFPEHWGVQLPMYVGYSETVRTPKYSPLQPDVVLTDVPNVDRRLKKKSQTYTKLRSINFSEIRISPKEKAATAPEEDKGAPPAPGAKSPGGGAGAGDAKKEHFYDIKNFALSYSYNESYFRDINTDWKLNKQYRGGFNYSFSNKPKEIKPFQNLGIIKTSPYLKWLKEFNFYPGVKQVSFSTEMNRIYETSRIRNNTLELTGLYSDMLITTQVQKRWNWNRQYTVKYDLTKNLKFSYTASNQSLVEEPRGVIDRENQDWYDAYKDTVWTNIRNFGETTLYNHNVGATYKLPLDKFPLIDFLSSDASYTGTFRWDRAPFTQDTLGHTIQNSRQLQWTIQGNFETLYNKSDRLKQINQGKKKKDDKKGKENPDNKDGFGKDLKEKEDKKEPFNFGDAALRFMMMIRNVNYTYTRNEGILLPGYNRRTTVGGFDSDFSGPGVDFLIGGQNTDIWGNPNGGNYALEAANNGWLYQQPYLNNQYNETFSETWNYKINLEPIRYLKIELTANRTEGRNNNAFFRYDPNGDVFTFQSPMETGNFSASINSWSTAFVKDQVDNGWTSNTFETFLTNRLASSARWNDATYGEATPNVNGYYQGWGSTSANVVIPAFIAAYTGQDVGEVSLNPFKTKVQPNWRITYDGLTKLPSIKKYFKQFNITHQYRSTLNTSYVRNLNFTSDASGLPTSIDASEQLNYIPQNQINTVTITENLSPLIGFDMTIKTAKSNDPQFKIELKRDRTVALGLSNLQITETKSNSLVIGVGYKLTEVRNLFGGKRAKLPFSTPKNTSINLRADLTIRDNTTLIRKIEENQNQPTAGQRLFSIKSSVDYMVNDKLSIRLFYDHQINKPKISTSFPTSNINAGVALRFTLNS
ncbi:MAG: cell surface protein SprA [Flavobacteriales bacterium]